MAPANVVTFAEPKLSRLFVFVCCTSPPLEGQSCCAIFDLCVMYEVNEKGGTEPMGVSMV